jgi:phosphoribosylamine--glycine ligase
MPRLQTDLVELCFSTWKGELDRQPVEIDPRTAVTIMLTSGGYPGNFEKGKSISGLDRIDGSRIYHAGTIVRDGEVVTSGGRVLAVTSMSSDMQRAIDKSLRNAEVISFEGKYYRKDIGMDLINVEC